MGIDYLHDYIGKTFPEDQRVDLIQIAKSISTDIPANCKKNGNIPQLSLVVDGETALNRLYGGYFSDWICGGQWNRMRSFIEDLTGKLNESNIELVVFFNGAIEPQRMTEWAENQTKEFIKIQKILSHINRRNVPPPKAWWTPPVGIRMAIRMMLKHANVNVISATNDYKQEIITYCRENNFHGIISDDAEFIAFNPPRLFSASHLKLAYKGTLETKEYVMADILEKLNFTTEKLCLLVSLLGNYLIPESQLVDIYARAGISSTDTNSENYGERVVNELAKFINTLKVSSNLDEVVKQLVENATPSVHTLKKSLQYYLNGTKDAFLKFHRDSSHEKENVTTTEETNSAAEPHLNTMALASESVDNLEPETGKNELTVLEESSTIDTKHKQEVNGQSNSDNASVTPSEDNSSLICKDSKEKQEKADIPMPPISLDVIKTLSERHSKGLMTPYLYQILLCREIKLPVLLEDGKEIPNIYNFYRPIRQMVYAIVFNLNHHKFMASKENRQLDIDIKVKEWVFNGEENIYKPEDIEAEPLAWGVPTIQRLWFGTLPDDRRRRLRAFLTCMRSDTPLIMNYEYVPQQSLVAAVVLRYIMSASDKKILKKQELDAFIVTAMAPESFDPQFTQQLKDPISSRSVQLAALFMEGVEMAILVNDACGAPVPWLMCCPWLFFDGRCFNHMFQKAMSCKNLYELCDNRSTLALRAERMRQAILEHLNFQFSRLMPPVMLQNGEQNHQYHQRGMLNRMRMTPTMAISSNNSARSLPADAGRGKKQMVAKLEVGGMVVSNWASYTMPQKSYETLPYMMSAQQYGKKKMFRKDKKPGRGRVALLETSTSEANISNAVNGNGSGTTEEKFNTPMVNGAAVEFIGEGEAPTVCDATSSLVEATTK